MINTTLFSIFSTLLLASSTMTIISKEPIHSALWLVSSFFAASSLWIALQAEFLGLVLILVYVGAVLTLFLFVMMTFPTDSIPTSSKWNTVAFYSPRIAVVVSWLSCLWYALYSQFTSLRLENAIKYTAMQSTSNTQLLGQQLYTQYLYPLELAGIILLIAVLTSISLHSNLASQRTKSSLSTKKHLNFRREERVKLVQGD